MEIPSHADNMKKAEDMALKLRKEKKEATIAKARVKKGVGKGKKRGGKK